MREQNLPQIVAKLPNHRGEHTTRWLNGDDDNETYLEDSYVVNRVQHQVPQQTFTKPPPPPTPPASEEHSV